MKVPLDLLPFFPLTLFFLSLKLWKNVELYPSTASVLKLTFTSANDMINGTQKSVSHCENYVILAFNYNSRKKTLKYWFICIWAPTSSCVRLNYFLLMHMFLGYQERAELVRLKRQMKYLKYSIDQSTVTNWCNFIEHLTNF